MDVENFENLCEEIDSQPANNLSPKSFSVICISDDEEDEDDEFINDLISRVDKEKYSLDLIDTCQKLLLHLDEKLRTEETLEILLAQMKMTQRKIKNSMNSPRLMTRPNWQNDSTIPYNDVTHSKVCENTLTLSPNNLPYAIPPLPSSDLSNPIIAVTDEMAKQALHLQCINRKTTFRNEVGKCLTEIFNTRYFNEGMEESNLYVNDFVAFVGMEEVVKNLASDKEHPQSANKKQSVLSIICDQCGLDFSLKPMNSKVYDVKGSLCEACTRIIRLNNVQQKCLDSIRLVVARYLKQEQTLDRDYKEVLTNPDKFEVFRQKLSSDKASHSNNIKSSPISVTRPTNGNINPNNIPTIALFRTPTLSQPVLTLNSRPYSTTIIDSKLLHPMKTGVVIPFSNQQVSQFKKIESHKSPISFEIPVDILTDQQRKDRALLMQKQNKETLAAILRDERLKTYLPKCPES